jgi:hypothetical protein
MMLADVSRHDVGRWWCNEHHKIFLRPLMVDPRFHAGYMCIGGVSHTLVAGAHGGQLVAASSEQPVTLIMLDYWSGFRLVYRHLG